MTTTEKFTTVDLAAARELVDEAYLADKDENYEANLKEAEEHLAEVEAYIKSIGETLA